jgi:hypothetical protein
MPLRKKLLLTQKDIHYHSQKRFGVKITYPNLSKFAMALWANLDAKENLPADYFRP